MDRVSRVPYHLDPREKRNKFWGPFLRCKSAPIHGRNSISTNSTQRTMSAVLKIKKTYQTKLPSRGGSERLDNSSKVPQAYYYNRREIETLLRKFKPKNIDRNPRKNSSKNQHLESYKKINSAPPQKPDQTPHPKTFGHLDTPIHYVPTAGSIGAFCANIHPV